MLPSSSWPVSSARARHVPGESAELTAPAANPLQMTRALAEFTRSSVAVTEFSVGQPRLDELFLSLTGHMSMTGTDPATEKVPALAWTVANAYTWLPSPGRPSQRRRARPAAEGQRPG
jgi:hypothetical protein